MRLHINYKNVVRCKNQEYECYIDSVIFEEREKIKNLELLRKKIKKLQ